MEDDVFNSKVTSIYDNDNDNDNGNGNGNGNNNDNIYIGINNTLYNTITR